MGKKNSRAETVGVMMVAPKENYGMSTRKLKLSKSQQCGGLDFFSLEWTLLFPSTMGRRDPDTVQSISFSTTTTTTRSDGGRRRHKTEKACNHASSRGCHQNKQ